MSDHHNTSSEEEKLNKFIEEKTIENMALKKLLDELNKDSHTTSSNNSKK